MTEIPGRIEFEGSAGALLAGRLEMPQGPAQAFALFAHCFTCSKDTHAAARIARGLRDHGIAVLRFDFTGLGQSGGDFANTNFSSNVEDLIRAADYLREAHRAPALLIGHSLGGAAALAAASRIPEVAAVATIGAPADAAHVARHFGAHVDTIETAGEAQVKLGGRTFPIRRQFLEDIRTQKIGPKIAELRKALLIFHAPRDEVVGIDNAEAIFVAAKHPKSFVSLDGADHLLSRREDAAYVADVLAAWASRYIGGPLDASIAAPAPAPATDADRVTVAETGRGRYQNQITAGRHVFFADEPEDLGGTDTGPSPYDYLNAALGACTAMTMRMYADRKGIDAERFIVRVDHERLHARDCADCGEAPDDGDAFVDVMNRDIEIVGDISAEQRDRLMHIADRCPVHRTLENRIVVRTRRRG